MARMNLNIVVCGLTGAGKSMIANGLVGYEVFKEGDRLVHETQTVTAHSREVDSVLKITVYDTPGFEDDTGNVDRYVDDIRRHCQHADLLLYCISALEARPMLERDSATLNVLKNALDSSV